MSIRLDEARIRLLNINGGIQPTVNNTYNLGTSSLKWANVYATTFQGNATSATKLATARTIQTNLASTASASFDGTINITPGVTGILGIGNGGTGANNRKTAITNLGIFGLYSRDDIGISPNFDNPGVNGLFEMRSKAETTGETGSKPFDGFAPFISLRYSNTMFQLAGTNTSGFFIRGKQAVDPTLTGIAWQNLLTSENYTNYTVTKTGSGASGTWGINVTGSSASCTGNAATASSIAWENITGKPSNYTPSSHSHSSITYTDTRSDNQNPDTTVAGLSVHLKASNTDGISDGGIYHAVLNVKDWGDYSGGPYWQATVTANDNMYYRRSTSGTAWGNWRKVWAQGDLITGAVWNDYAEFRESNEQIKPGRVVIENGDDTLSLSNQRLQPGANIVSDTYGFAIGETSRAQTPIAVSGRVLAYPYEPRDTFSAGDAVCSGPNGTVSKMTREEIVMYPERIIGTVSAIPDYEIWGTGNVPVNGRIWIKVV